MCPYCVTAAVWIAAGAVTTSGVSALAVAKFWNKKPDKCEQGAGNDDE